MSSDYDELYDDLAFEAPGGICPVAKWINLQGNDIFFESVYLYKTGVTLIFLKKTADHAEFSLHTEGNTYEDLYLRQYAKNPDELPTPVFDTVINGLRALEGSVVVFKLDDGERFFPGLKNSVLGNENIPPELGSGDITVIKTDLIYYETISRIEKIELIEPESSYENHLVRKDFTLDYGASDIRVEYGTSNGVESFFIVEKFEAVNLKTLFLNDDEYISRYLDEGRSLEAIAKSLEEMNCDTDYLVMSLRRPEQNRSLNFYLREHLENPVIHNDDTLALQDFGCKNNPTGDGLYKTMWIFNEAKGVTAKDAKRQYDICLFSVTDSFATEMNTFFTMNFSTTQ